MSKKAINQNTNYDSELLNSIDSNFVFNENPINRLRNTADNVKKDNTFDQIDKEKELNELKLQINSINDCNLKDNSKKIVLGDGNINSPIMLVGEAPGAEEDSVGKAFLGEVGDLLKKMLNAINIKKEDIYFCLARDKKEWELGQKKYYLSVFNTLNHAELKWKETFGKNGKSTGWSASNDNMNCKISKSMSDQLWTEIKEDYVDEEYSITIR